LLATSKAKATVRESPQLLPGEDGKMRGLGLDGAVFWRSCIAKKFALLLLSFMKLVLAYLFSCFLKYLCVSIFQRIELIDTIA
jgi:hypothetical protein